MENTKGIWVCEVILGLFTFPSVASRSHTAEAGYLGIREFMRCRVYDASRPLVKRICTRVMMRNFTEILARNAVLSYVEMIVK